MSTWQDYRPSLRTILLSIFGALIIALTFFFTKPPGPDKLTEYTLTQKGGPEAIAPYKPTIMMSQAMPPTGQKPIPTGERPLTDKEISEAYHREHAAENELGWLYYQTEIIGGKKKKPSKHKFW